MHRARIFAVLLIAPVAAFAQDSKPTEPMKSAELSGYKTVKTAEKADPNTFKSTVGTRPVTPGFLGIELLDAGKPAIGEIAPGSPAEKAGLKPGDRIVGYGGDELPSIAFARDRLRSTVADEKILLKIERDGKPLEVAVLPKATSKPFAAASGGPPQSTRVLLGVSVGESLSKGGVAVEAISTGGAAEKAGIKVKDILLQIDEIKLDEHTGLRDILNAKRAGDVVDVMIVRDGKELTLKAKLTAEAQQPSRIGNSPSWDDRLPNAWKKDKYRLAVIGIEYPDVKHSGKIADADWEKSLFSTGEYTGRSATGQRVHGSMADYYKEVSCGKFAVEGRFLGWTEVKKNRMDYSSGSGTSRGEKTALLAEALDKLLEKDKEALKDFDGIFFLFAGDAITTTRGSLYWPHRASVRHAGMNWPYFIVQEGGKRMTDISVFCHEFGHMLGLPDLYSRPEVPGMEGVGVWCAMSQQFSNGRPQHFSAWAKEQLGWLKPAMIDPRVKQKLVLSPIENSSEECFKVPLKADGSEYLLIENRKKKGFDAELPAEGLLIWRVIPSHQTQKVFLEESHGVEGPTGPRSFAGAVPYPSPANDSFTPYTTPSSKAQTGGGLDVHITSIRRLTDGRITFHIGYDYH